MDIDKAFEEFMEFPENSDKKTVTTVSCKLFAKWYSEQLQKWIDEEVEKIVKKTLDEDALTAAYLYGFSDARKRIKLLEQRIIELQGHDDLSYIEQQMCSLRYATAAVSQLLENKEG